MEGTTNKILAAIGTERLLGMVHQWFIWPAGLLQVM